MKNVEGRDSNDSLMGHSIDPGIKNIESEGNFFESLLMSLATRISVTHVFGKISKSLGYDEKVREFLYCKD
ncbi:MAG: hypothetical protein NPIRA03_35920 [Nitrospirales bacterium]|nr:MAG: hypothetical protein NPIRA03_35920 [Nitrospirales bacterium]